MEHFAPLLERAIRGELADWSQEPRSRLALIIVLDQFSRVIYQGSALAFAQDEQACALTIEGIEIGHYAALATPGEKTFFFLPLSHAEQNWARNQELVVSLADELVATALPEHQAMLEFSAAQAHRHREVLNKFERHPHRNELLGRRSTPAELEYLAGGQLIHTRPLPPNLAKYLTRD